MDDDQLNDIRIIVADDETIIRSALVELIALRPGLHAIAGAANGAEAVDLAKAHAPDIAVLDADMPVMNGIDACKEISALGIKVVVLTASLAHETMRTAMAAGASAYVTKATAVGELCDIVVRVAGGQSYVDPQMAALMMSGPKNPLSPREIEVLTLAVPGTPVTQIARELHLAEGTVRNYLSSAMSSLGARNRHEAARIAAEKGWM